MKETYKVVREFHPILNRSDRVLLRGLTRAEAIAHCRDPASRKAGGRDLYFEDEYVDGWEEDVYFEDEYVDGSRVRLLREWEAQ